MMTTMMTLWVPDRCRVVAAGKYDNVDDRYVDVMTTLMVMMMLMTMRTMRTMRTMTMMTTMMTLWVPDRCRVVAAWKERRELWLPSC